MRTWIHSGKRLVAILFLCHMMSVMFDWFLVYWKNHFFKLFLDCRYIRHFSRVFLNIFNLQWFDDTLSGILQKEWIYKVILHFIAFIFPILHYFLNNYFLYIFFQMIELNQWRSTIGRFNHRRWTKSQSHSTESPCCFIVLSAIVAFSCVLLLSGDVELNPGPG